MSGPPPPPPPHGQNPKTTSGSGLPPGKFDIFIIPPDSAGGGFLYLPSLRPSVNSYAAGFATAMVLVVITQSLAPAFQTWWAQFSGIGNLGMMLLTIGLSVGAWALGRAQAGGGGTSNGFPGFGPTSGAGPGTFPNPGGGYASPPPQPDQHGSPPPHTSSHGGPQSGGMPNGSWQQRPPQPEPADREPGPEDSDPQPQPQPQPQPRKQPEPEPEPKQEAEPPKPEPANEKSSQKAPPKPEPEPEAQKNAWERAREETRRREEDKRKAEEERKKVEAENKRKEEAQRRLKEMRARELRERQKREKEKKEAAAKAAAEDQARRDKERRDQEEKEKLVREKELRERELAELKEARRVEKERREKAERELKERLEKERVEKELRDQRAREIKERLEYEAREKERIERIKREQEILERERLTREAREREHKEREDKERREREAREREAREREAREREAREREAREREAREREAREAEARRLKEEQENANRRSTYAYTSVGEKTTLWPNGKPAIPHPPAPASASGQSTPTRGPPSPTKRPPPPTARTDAGTEDAYSYRPYDKPKAHTRRKSNASYVSDASWAPSQSTSRTTPPPSTRGSRPRYSTNDPDKIVISAVYGFLNSFAKTPASQLLSGMAPVTDGLILRITTEGIFIDDDVRKVPQREWDVKAWTLKQVDIWCACHSVVSAAAAAAVPSHLHKVNGPRLKPSERGTKTLNGPDADDYLQALHTTCENNCKLGQAPADHEVSGPHLHVLRATLRDQEGKRYLFIVPEEEGWKVAIGLKRLRGSSQVRTLGVAGMPRDEAINILSTLGF